MAETKKYVPDNIEWSKNQARIFKLTRNHEQEKRHLEVAAELEWLRKDLMLAMTLLNRLRIAEDLLITASVSVDKP